jgi:hypothetical protein
MSRPAVIVGLGGTGQWVLTMLKKDLLEQNGMLDRPKDPIPNVRLIALDTLAKPEATINNEAQRRYEGEKRIGNISLEKDREYIALGGDCKPIAERIRRAERSHEHLRFFQTDFYEKDMQFQDDNWFLENGAGQFRQFGALSVYKELLQEGPQSIMFRALEHAIRDVRPDDNNTKIEIIVVSSLVGGTGSGMIIPIGILLNQMMQRIAPRQGNFRSVVVMPSAFTQGMPNQQMNIRALAALRELWRQQIPPDDPREVTLAPGMDGYARVEYKSPYQGIYLIEGLNNNNISMGNVYEGVFPAVALWIQQVIDTETGDAYRGFVETNRKGAAALTPLRAKEGVFGTFGSYSMFTPEVMLHQTHSLKLVNAVVEHLASDYQSQEDGTAVTTTGIERELTPKQAARAWLRQNIIHDGKTQNAPRLFSEWARILDAGGKNNNTEIGAKALAGLPWPTQKGPKPKEIAPDWAELFRNLDLSPEDELQYREALSEFDATFAKAFPMPLDTVQNANSTAHKNRLENPNNGVMAFINRHHGQKGQNNDWGQFGDAVKAMLPYYTKAFRAALKLHLLATLSAAGGQAQKGRIHYAIQILNQIEGDLLDMLEFLKHVAVDRETTGSLNLAYTGMVDARQEWTNTPAKVKKGFFDKVLEAFTKEDKLNQAMLSAERMYLLRCNMYTNCLRENALAFYLSEVIKDSLAFLRSSRDGLKTWRFSLSEGNPAQKIKPLRQYATDELENIQDIVKKSQRNTNVERLTQVNEGVEEEISVLNYSPAAEDVIKALSGLVWVPTEDEESGRLTFKLHVKPVDSSSETTIDLLDPTQSAQVIQRTQEKNMSELVKILSRSYKNRPSIISWLQQNYPADSLANEMLTRTNPIARFTSNFIMGKYFVFSANWGTGITDYRQEITEYLRQNKKMEPNEFIVTNFENPYRLTAFYARTGLILDDFNTWQECQTSFTNYVSQELEKTRNNLPKLVRLMQSFYTQMEEQEAVSLEVRQMANGFGYRMTDPRVVQLLGRKPDLDRALKCFAMGWIAREQSERGSGITHWKLAIPDLPKDMEIWLTPDKVENENEPVDDFEALHSMVVIGKNRCPLYGRQGTRLDMTLIDAALRKAEELCEGETEPAMTRYLRNASNEKTGLYGRWVGKAHRTVLNNIENIDDPAYWDIANYAKNRYAEMLSK